jgi:hypothetical protein
MNAISKTLAAVTLGFAALGAQAGEIATGDLQSQRAAASSTVVMPASVAGVSGEIAVGDLGLRAVNSGTAPAVTMAGGRIESRFAVGA